jgi:adenosylhomocysteine nucleosidase
MTSKPLIVMALEVEGQGVLESLGFEVLYCGVGKVNAAHHLTRRLSKAEAKNEVIPYVLNLGSAGSVTYPRGSVIAADRFVQHDMDARGIGFALGETPFDAVHMLSFPQYFVHLPHGVCASGDLFSQTPPGLACDLIDMEAYALAKVSHYHGIPFACVKYVTDGSDGAAAVDWQHNVQHAAQAFRALLAEEA